jgi:hypothetical protein
MGLFNKSVSNLFSKLTKMITYIRNLHAAKKLRTYIVHYSTLIPAFFLTMASLNSCNKNSNSPYQPPPQVSTRDTTITDSSIYIDVTINGNRIFKIQHVDSSWGMAWFSGNFPPDTTVSIYALNRIGGTFDSLTSTLPGLGFSKGDINYLSYGYPQTYYLMKSEVLDSFFQAGNYSFSRLSKDTSYTVVYDSQGDTLTGYVNPVSGKILTSGIQLSWFDSTGKAWKSYLGTGDQSGSYFKIIKAESIPNTNTPGYSNYEIVTAEFSCMLYDSLGNSIQLTNGRFRLWAIV